MLAIADDNKRHSYGSQPTRTHHNIRARIVSGIARNRSSIGAPAVALVRAVRHPAPLRQLHINIANVQMLPGGSVFIVAVQSHHRGRIFLPFADEDPKTAEVLSKALLLARDNEIRDPAILDQIHR